MLAIRLPAAIEKRLERLAKRTGRTKSFYAREAILEHLEDLEDVYAAERALDRFRKGKERAIPLEEIMKRQREAAGDNHVTGAQTSFFSGKSIAELAKAQQVKPLKSIRALAGGWPEDDELDDVLKEIYRDREL
jgi:RHH-type rel operon transcriptional repressor/antitoxin RelB